MTSVPCSHIASPKLQYLTFRRLGGHVELRCALLLISMVADQAECKHGSVRYTVPRSKSPCSRKLVRMRQSRYVRGHPGTHRAESNRKPSCGESLVDVCPFETVRYSDQKDLRKFEAVGAYATNYDTIIEIEITKRQSYRPRSHDL